MAEYFITEIVDCDLCASANEKGQPHMLLMNEQGGFHYCSGKIERQVNLLDVLKKLRWTQYSPRLYDGEGGDVDRQFEDLRIEDE